MVVIMILSALRFVGEALLRPYAQIVFSRNLLAGALVLGAVLTFPRLGLATLGAVVVAGFTAYLFGLGASAVREGGYGCTAVLTTLSIGVFFPGGGQPILLVVLGAMLAVLFSASFEAVFAPVALPTHSLPFIASAWTVSLASRSLPATSSLLALDIPLAWIPDRLFQPSWVDVPASLVFLHGGGAGVLVLLAIAVHSRISLILAGVGGAVALAMRVVFRPDMPWSAVDITAAFNALLAAIAMGGVWFVPQLSSLLFAVLASAVSCALAYALFPAAGYFSLPVLSLPFVITTHMLLTAARRRLQDRRPRSAVPDERPEDVLARHLMWVRRYGDVAWLPFRLPFRGEWIVTQGHNGEHTHKGPWRYGLDFQAQDKSGKIFKGKGAELRDHFCYGLPVVAAGDGSVVKVVDGVADNPPGEVNTHENWGNVVVIAHGRGLYSVYAHLQLRSIRVKVGDVVTSGSELARCGNSGRSPTPHLHFQVQQAITLGSPTIPVDFGDVVSREENGYTLANRVIPAKDDVVRPVVREEALARSLAFPPGSSFILTEKGTGRREVAQVQVDLFGRRFLESTRARLFLDPYDAALVFVDFKGDPRSLLRYLLVCITRVPFDQTTSLTWRDSFSRRLLLPGWLRAAADLTAVVLPEIGNIEMLYGFESAEGKLQVRGTGKKWSTRATLSFGDGPHRFEIDHRKDRGVMEMRRVDPEEKENGL